MKKCGKSTLCQTCQLSQMMPWRQWRCWPCLSQWRPRARSVVQCSKVCHYVCSGIAINVHKRIFISSTKLSKSTHTAKKETYTRAYVHKIIFITTKVHTRQKNWQTATLTIQQQTNKQSNNRSRWVVRNLKYAKLSMVGVFNAQTAIRYQLMFYWSIDYVSCFDSNQSASIPVLCRSGHP